MDNYQSNVLFDGVVEDSVSNNSKFTLNKKNIRLNEERERFGFYKDLHHFHEVRGTPYARIPKISGKDIDLYQLYTNVTSRGGWLKVNNKNEWDDLLTDFKLPSKCVNATAALKQIYIRYLDRYEKVHFHGDDNDRGDDDDDEIRHKRWSAKALHSVSMTYNYNQHNVVEANRAQHKLSTCLYHASEYDKLLLSLLSPLPNEQDFGINVCTLMSNEGQQILKIEKCPKLVDTLLAHAGIFNHYSTRNIFFEYYSKIRKHSLQKFWNDCLHEKIHILELSYDDFYSPPFNKIQGVIDDTFIRPNSEKNNSIKEANDIKIDKDETHLDFLCLGRGLGTHDYVGQRVLQVASILRNLSFNDDNVVMLAKNKTFVRFLIMCSNARWNNLHHMALDMLGNIAPELELIDPASDELTRCLFTTVSEGLESPDRGVIISCLEVLYKMCQKSNNEEFIHKWMNQKMYNQICLYLCLSDIMLLLYTLECIYALSTLGEKPCNAIVQVRGVIDTLVSLVTVEAQSYGQDACISMRVVETVSTSMMQQTQHNITAANVTHPPPLSTPKHTPILNESPKPASPISTLTSENQKSQATLVVHQPNSPVIRSSIIAPPQTQQPMSSPNQTIVAQPQPSVIAKHAQQQANQENEQFALVWLRATFEPAASLSCRVEQQELYKMYLAASNKIGRRGVVTPVHFPRCVRSIFGGTVGPNLIKSEQNGIETSLFSYEGIRLRTNPLTLVHKGVIVSPPTPQTKTIDVIPIKQQLQNQCGDFKVINKNIVCSSSTVLTSTTQTTTTTNQQKQSQISSGFGSNVGGSMLVAQICGKNVVINSPQQSPILQQVLTNNPMDSNNLLISQQQKVIQNATTGIGNVQHQKNIISNNSNAVSNVSNNNIITSTTSIPSSLITSTTTSSSLIKSLLANKVTTNDANNSTTTASNLSTCLIAPNINMHQVAQRQQLQKQKELAQQIANQSIGNNNNNLNPSIISATTASNIMSQQKITNVITAIKSCGTLMQNNIKPITTIIEKKIDNDNSNKQITNNKWDPVPPLAPLSCSQNSITIKHTNQQHPSVIVNKIDDDSNSTGNNSVASSLNQNLFIEDSVENSLSSFEGLIIKRNQMSEDDSNSKESMKQSQVVTANKMLADLLERKSSDPPPYSITGDLKRKIDNVNEAPAAKKAQKGKQNEINGDEATQRTVDDNDTSQVKASTNIANLYAELAASMLEDEDLDDEIKNEAQQMVAKVEPIQKMNQIKSVIQQVEMKPKVEIIQVVPSQQQQQQKLIQQVHQQQQSPQQLQQTQQAQQQSQHQQQVISMPVPLQRQIIVTPNNQAQMILSPNNSGQQQITTQTTATIKTDTGYQTVPVILQHTQAQAQAMQANIQNMQLQKQMTASGQLMQPILSSSPGQTQYVLTTNQQGQTVVVAQPQQHQPMHQTVLVTQTPQQQGTSAKTIIILQQQPSGGTHNQVQANNTLMNAMNAINQSGQPQKMIMTTQQGQQVIVTQVPRPLHHVLVNNQLQQQGSVVVSNANTMNTTNAIIQSKALENKQILVSGSLTSDSHSQLQQHLQIQQIQQSLQQQQQHQQIQLTAQQLQQIQAGQHIQFNHSHQQATMQIQHIQPNQQIQLQTGQHVQIQQQQPNQQIQVLQHQPHTVQLQLQQPQQQQQQIQLQAITQSNQIKQPVTLQIQPGTTQAQILSQPPVLVPQQTVIQQNSSIQNQPISTNTQIQQTTPVVSIQNVQQNQQSFIQQQPLAQTQPPQQQVQSQPQQQTIQAQQQQQPLQPQTQQSNVNNQAPQPSEVVVKCEDEIELNWLWICDWRGCPKKKFRSANEVYLHACSVHCPDTLEASAEIYCQWGPGNNLCDNIPRKRFSLMTHISDRHCTTESFKMAMQRRVASGNTQSCQATVPVTILKNPTVISSPSSPAGASTTSTGLSSSNSCDLSSSSEQSHSAALHAIKRHAQDFVNPKELLNANGSTNSVINTAGDPGRVYPETIITGENINFSSTTAQNLLTSTVNSATISVSVASTSSSNVQSQSNNTNITNNNINNSSSSSCDGGVTNVNNNNTNNGNVTVMGDDNEGPVTKSIRLTAALILRNLVNNSVIAKRNLRYYEPHLAGVALSNVESSRTIAQVLYEMN